MMNISSIDRFDSFTYVLFKLDLCKVKNKHQSLELFPTDKIIELFDKLNDIYGY